MGKITYHHHHDCAVMYLNIVEKYSCTNDCRFCDKEDIEMNLGGIYTMRGDLYLKKRPTLQEIIYRIDAEVEANHPQEAVFCQLFNFLSASSRLSSSSWKSFPLRILRAFSLFWC